MAVPPVVVAVNDPVEPPLQLTLVFVVIAIEGGVAALVTGTDALFEAMLLFENTGLAVPSVALQLDKV